ncbi:hypothetical protein D3C86_1977440 [compost metagenome]
MKPIEFSINSIEQLQDMMGQKSATINITVPIKLLDQMMLNKLETMFKESEEGNCSVKFTVVDHLDNLTVSMPSKRLRINPSARMLSEMKEMQLEVGFDTN